MKFEKDAKPILPKDDPPTLEMLVCTWRKYAMQPRSGSLYFSLRFRWGSPRSNAHDNSYDINSQHTRLYKSLRGIRTNHFRETQRRMNHRMLLNPKHPKFPHEWALTNLTTTFFKCTRWQVEETTDPIVCPYHYFCDSNYAGNYPAAVDLTVLFVAVVSYLLTVGFAAAEVVSSRKQPGRRLWVPSGPFILPLLLLCLAKGHRINTGFPLSLTAPALLQLIHVSALAFQNPPAASLKSIFLEVSTISGILHGCLYVDSVILPYYTGLEALVSSTFSGECPSCICRKEILTVGGNYIPYQGWSATMAPIAGILCLRLAFGVYNKTGKLATATKLTLEVLAWLMIMKDNARLIENSVEGPLVERVASGSICLLIWLLLLKRFHDLVGRRKHPWDTKTEPGLPLTDTDYDEFY